jgi:hypothetical protein
MNSWGESLKQRTGWLFDGTAREGGDEVDVLDSESDTCISPVKAREYFGKRSRTASILRKVRMRNE